MQQQRVHGKVRDRSAGLMTLQGLGPVLVGTVAGLIGTGQAMAAAGGATVLTAAWMAGWWIRRAPDCEDCEGSEGSGNQPPSAAR